MSRAAVISRKPRVEEPESSVEFEPVGLDLPMCVAMGVLLTLGLVMVYT